MISSSSKNLWSKSFTIFWRLSYLFLSISIQREAAIDIVANAIQSGIFNDLGSGSNVDVCVITAKGSEYMRNYQTPNERGKKEQKYGFARGTTRWTKEQIREMIVQEGELMMSSNRFLLFFQVQALQPSRSFVTDLSFFLSSISSLFSFPPLLRCLGCWKVFGSARGRKWEDGHFVGKVWMKKEIQNVIL